MFESEQESLTDNVKEICSQMGFTPFEPHWTWIPFNGQWGISTSFFSLAALQVKENKSIKVNEAATQIAKQVKAALGNLTDFTRIDVVGGYLNFYFDTKGYSRKVIDAVLDEGERYGQGSPTHQMVMVEFSQPNSLKPFHVGHLRNMVLGAALSNLLEASGDQVIRANYLGDIGLHVITWLWNYLKYHRDEMPPSENKIQWMGNLYAEAVKRRDETPENEAEVRAFFKRWDQRDPEIVALWKKTRAWSLEAFDQVYKTLGINFDHLYYESEVEESGKKLVADLVHRGIAKDERPEGAVFIDLDEILGTKETYRVLVLLRSDGTSLYSTKDIPLAIKKFEQYPLDRSIYVVDVRQSLYLKQVFKILELLGYAWAKNCYHLAYEIVNLPGNVTIASREGTVVLLEDLIREAENHARLVVDQKNPGLPENEKKVVARQVGLGAIKYSLLEHDNTKIVTFDWESALDVNGQAAPYIQYAAVRANSILNKANIPIPEAGEITHPLTSQEIQLVDLISRLPQEVQRSAREMRPIIITSLAYEIARAFNDFYTNCPVLKAEKEVRDFRIRLVAATRQTIINLLKLLGIEVPNVM
jgi:arginyl-tRNA synthetase